MLNRARDFVECFVLVTLWWVLTFGVCLVYARFIRFRLQFLDSIMPLVILYGVGWCMAPLFKKRLKVNDKSGPRALRRNRRKYSS